MIVGLSATLPADALPRARRPRRPAGGRTNVADLPPVSDLFAAFLGYNPIQQLVGAHVLAHLPAAVRRPHG